MADAKHDVFHRPGTVEGRRECRICGYVALHNDPMYLPCGGPEKRSPFAWASIAGADPEPVELVEVEGRQALLTCGCQDPFFLDGDTEVTVYVNKLERPENILTREEQNAKDQAYIDRQKALSHRWRGPR